MSRTSAFASDESSTLSRVRASSPCSATAKPLSAIPRTRAVSKTYLRVVIPCSGIVDGYDGVPVPEAVIAMTFRPGIRDPLGAVDDEHVGVSARLQRNRS